MQNSRNVKPHTLNFFPATFRMLYMHIISVLEMENFTKRNASQNIGTFRGKNYV